MNGDHVATAQLMWLFRQEEVGAGGNELRGVEVAAANAGGERGTPATHLLQTPGMACPEQWAPLGQLWVRVQSWGPQQGRRAWMARLGPQ